MLYTSPPVVVCPYLHIYIYIYTVYAAKDGRRSQRILYKSHVYRRPPHIRIYIYILCKDIGWRVPIYIYEYDDIILLRVDS